MVHNGIEYGMMAAIAEGLSVIRGADVGLHQDEADAETAPLRDPWAYQYEIDVSQVAEVWRRGSVISSWLVDLTAAAFAKSPKLEEFSGRVSDSGEGRWTVLAAVDEGVPASVIAASLYERFDSRDAASSRGRSCPRCARSSAGTWRRRLDPWLAHASRNTRAAGRGLRRPPRLASGCRLVQHGCPPGLALRIVG